MKINKRWAVLGLAGFLAALGVAWKAYHRRMPAAVYKQVSIERGDIQVTVTATGIVQPQNRLEIKVPITGRLEEILVREGDRVRKGQVLTWMSSLDRAALIDAARSKGPQELARWQEIYKPTPLIAPMDGVVIARNMEPGQTVTTQDIPLVMSDRLIVKAQVDETDIAQIHLKQSALVVLDAYSDREIPSQVDHIAFEAKTVNNVTIYEVDVLPLRLSSFMRSGMTANVTFVVSKRKDVLIVPQEALEIRLGRTFVSVPGNSEKSALRKVEIRAGLSDGRKTEVLSGLNEGDRVSVLQMPRAKSGSKQKSSGSNPFMPGGRRSR